MSKVYNHLGERQTIAGMNAKEFPYRKLSFVLKKSEQMPLS